MGNLDIETIETREIKHVDVGRNYYIISKIFTHFIKGQISFFFMETILAIPHELESLESLVKLARKKQNDGFKSVKVIKVERSPALHKININRNDRSKTLHLLVKINNNLVEQLVDTNASMSIAWINAFNV
jgi:hypothetical protein